ncbi:hypothetical protein HGRIS_004654 [Hohenbuehelia grisea]|uniref:Uncharacterized protein n=1 Tax=Hohenbuehelia grisea TaxID=104357 RepID=A0ABR3JD74_9AGAR
MEERARKGKCTGKGTRGGSHIASDIHAITSRRDSKPHPTLWHHSLMMSPATHSHGASGASTMPHDIWMQYEKSSAELSLPPRETNKLKVPTSLPARWRRIRTPLAAFRATRSTRHSLFFCS